jgi:hypothetical protein
MRRQRARPHLARLRKATFASRSAFASAATATAPSGPGAHSGWRPVVGQARTREMLATGEFCYVRLGGFAFVALCSRSADICTAICGWCAFLKPWRMLRCMRNELTRVHVWVTVCKTAMIGGRGSLENLTSECLTSPPVTCTQTPQLYADVCADALPDTGTLSPSVSLVDGP